MEILTNGEYSERWKVENFIVFLLSDDKCPTSDKKANERNILYFFFLFPSFFTARYRFKGSVGIWDRYTTVARSDFFTTANAETSVLRASHTGPYATMLTKMRAARRELRQTVVPRRIPPRSQFSTIFSGGKSCPRCANFNQLPRPPKNARIFNLSFYSNESFQVSEIERIR